MAVYNITFFTSEEGKDVAFTLESKKLTTKDFSSFEFIRVLKLFIGGKDKIVENKTYILQIAANWKDLLIAHLTRWSETFRELNNVIALISQLDEGRCLGISFNDNLDIQKSKELYFLMQEVEQGIPAKPRYEEFLRQYSDFFNVYRPLSYSHEKRIRFGNAERKSRVCRYCGRSVPETTFNHNSHTISNCLGNINYFTNDECDKCNTKFGATIEQELLKYVSISRVLSGRYEGFKQYKTQIGSFELGINPKTNQIEFKETTDKSPINANIINSDQQIDIFVDGGYIDFVDVYRALVKFVIGMLPEKELKYFMETINWVNKEVELQLPNIKETIYKDPEQHPFINMFFRENNSDFPYLCAEMHVNHYEFVFAVPGCSLDKSLKENIMDDFLKLRKDGNKWRNISFEKSQPTRMELHVSLYKSPLQSDNTSL